MRSDAWRRLCIFPRNLLGEGQWTVPSLLAAAVLAGFVFTYVLVLTRRGPGLVPDSAAYFGAARNLLSGHGLTTPAEMPRRASG